MNKYLYISLVILLLASGVEASNTNKSSLLVSDKNCYISGDYIFVQAFAPFHKNNAAIYIDLITSNKEFIVGEIFHLDNGNASGYIQIPDTLKTGEYSIRSYTYASIQERENKILAQKLIFITNRFGNNGELFELKNDTIKFGTIELGTIENESIFLSISDTIQPTRSKVLLSLELNKNSQNENFKGVVCVKPISQCETDYSYGTINMWPSNVLQAEMNLSDNDKSKVDEHKGIIISGYAKHSITGSALVNNVILLAFEDSILRLKHCITDSNGWFSFLITNCFEEQEVFLSAYSFPSMELNKAVSFLVDNKFLTRDANNRPKGKFIGYQQSNDSLNLMKSIIAKAYEINYKQDVVCSSRDNISYEHSYMCDGFTRTTNIDDYIALPDFYQIAREILPFLKIREKAGNYSFAVFDGTNNLVRDNPMVFVDGVPLTDYNEIIKWGTDRIKQVQVKVEPRYYGDVPFENGIVLIWTRKMDFWKDAKCINTYRITIPCFQRGLSFNFPDYSKESNSTIPDFRSVLFWEPNIELSEDTPINIEFFTSDEKGVFEVNVKGLTSANKPVYIRKYFEVK